MIYIVYFEKDEILLNRIGEKELQHYSDLKDFLPLLEKRGTVVQIENPGKQIDSVYNFANYLEQPTICISFSAPDQTFANLQCPKYIFPAKIPPPVWDRYKHLAKVISLDNTKLPVIATNGNIIDTYLKEFIPKSIVRIMPWRRSLEASWFALKKSKLRLALYYLLRRKSRHYFSEDLSFSGVVYTTFFRSSYSFEHLRNLIGSFHEVFKKESDVTLIIKIVGVISDALKTKVLNVLKQKSMACRVVLINEHLPLEQYENLMRNSSFLINLDTSKIRKPVLVFMSAGIPVVSVQLDDFMLTDQRGMIIIDKGELMEEQLLRSFKLYKYQSENYCQISNQATENMKNYCSRKVVEPQVDEWLDKIETEIF